MLKQIEKGVLNELFTKNVVLSVTTLNLIKFFLHFNIFISV